MNDRMFSRRRLLGNAAASFGAAAGIARHVFAAEGASAAPKALRIGFQKSSVNLVVLKQQGLLEQRFAASKVSWSEFPAGPQLLEALAVGSLDIGFTGDTPPVFAQAAGKDLIYIGAEPPKPLSSAVLAPPGSPLRTLADLKGRKLALQKGSSAHYLSVRALDKAGLAWSDITPVYLPPADARAAFEKGAVDAWAIWDPYYAAAELALKPVVLSNGVDLSNNNSFYFASRSFADAHPQAIRTLLTALAAADDHVQQHRDDTVRLITELTGLDAQTVRLFLSRRPVSPVAPLAAQTIADQQRVADAFARIGLIPKPVRVADIVWQAPAS